MPTYEYECRACGYQFEMPQGMLDAPLKKCPECQGPVRRLVSGWLGFILKGRDSGRVAHQGQACSRERGSGTCCGREERCDRPPCGDN
ncbi:MAG: FmdB family zinc ribbon protein [Thermodesulfobacteriota bacterium]